VLENTTPVKKGNGDKSSTNYHPTFTIVGWAARGDLGEVPAQPMGNPPDTGSTRAEPPMTASAVDLDEFV
jgi:hypothetical protein